MTVWQFREWVESNLPAWILFIPLVSLLIILILTFVVKVIKRDNEIADKIRDYLNKDLK